MVKLDKNVMYYLAHPYDSGDKRKNRLHEAECCKRIRISQDGYDMGEMLNIDGIKLLRPLNTIPPGVSREEAMGMCLILLSACKGIIMCGDWQNSIGCQREYQEAKARGIRIYGYMDVVR